MSFFENFGKSAFELKSIRCITVTGVLIALDLVLKLFSINITNDLKITFAFIALATIGMLYGPTVAFLAGAITDILGFLIKTDGTSGGFSPLFTLIEAVGAMIYGIFLYGLKPLVIKETILDDKSRNSSLAKEILICDAFGAGLGAIFGIVMYIVYTIFSGIQTDDKNLLKISASLSEPILIVAAVFLGFIYGTLFAFIIRASRSHKGEFGKSARVIVSKIVVVIVCNLIMTPMAMVLSGYMTWESMLAAYPLRLVKNAIQCPVDCIILMIVIFPVLAAYKKIFPNNTSKIKKAERGSETE
jgi:ECF transporter S component (folate family)